MRKWFQVLFVFVLAAAVAHWRCGGTQSVAPTGPAPAAELVVRVAPVEFREWILAVPISGSLRSQSVVDVKSEVGGKLLRMRLQEGDPVRKDQLLAQIDPANYQLAYNQAAAALAVAEAALERVKVVADHARREKERADNLLNSGGITQKDHQAAETGIKEAETQVRLAEAQCAQARAGLAVADKALKDCRIVAPVAGSVQRRSVDQGSLVIPGSTLCIIVDNSRLELEALLPSYRLTDIRIGQKAGFTTPTWGERRFQGLVTAINPMVEPDNRSVRIKLRIPNDDGVLRTGMYARGEIELSREPRALVIPRSALIAEEERASAGGIVYVVSEGKARRRAIEIAGIKDDFVWVSRGLEADDRVIREIGPSIKEGTAVRISPDPSAAVQ